MHVSLSRGLAVLINTGMNVFAGTLIEVSFVSHRPWAI